jgi:hypothetical protein
VGVAPEKRYGEVELRGGIVDVQWESRTEGDARPIGTRERDEVAASSAGTGGIGETQSERLRDRCGIPDELVGVSGISDQRIVAERD